MQLSSYAKILYRSWWIIAIAAVLAVVSAYIFSKVQTPVYRAEAVSQVVPSRNDNGLSIVLRDSMNSFRDLALAKPELQQISDRLRLDRTPEWLLSHIAVQPRPEDRKMIVQVDHTDPQTAVELANEISRNMIALVSSRNQSIEGTDKINVVLIEPAETVSLYRPQTRLNVLAAGVLGIILGILLAAVLDRLDNTIKTTEDVEDFLGLQVLGIIPTTGKTAREAAGWRPGRWRPQRDARQV